MNLTLMLILSKTIIGLMHDIISNLDFKGWVHFIAANLSLITGTYIILTKKGTRIHKIVGYSYVISMIVVLVTSFIIYRLFNGFGIFHAFACVSTLALLGGMLPMLKKNRTIKDLKQHSEVMGWSVVGLYCAFISETCSRLRFDHAMIVLGVGCGLTCFMGSKLIKKSLEKYYPRINDKLS